MRDPVRVLGRKGRSGGKVRDLPFEGTARPINQDRPLSTDPAKVWRTFGWGALGSGCREIVGAPTTPGPVTHPLPPTKPMRSRPLGITRDTGWRPPPGAQARNEILRASRHLGRTIWSGHHRPSRIGAKIWHLKLLRERLVARTFDRCTVELRTRTAHLNRFPASPGPRPSALNETAGS